MSDQVHVPRVWGAAVANVPFSYKGVAQTARDFHCSADGTLTVRLTDGSTANVPVVAGRGNLFQATEITNLNGLTVTWFA